MQDICLAVKKSVFRSNKSVLLSNNNRNASVFDFLTAYCKGVNPNPPFMLKLKTSFYLA